MMKIIISSLGKETNIIIPSLSFRVIGEEKIRRRWIQYNSFLGMKRLRIGLVR